MNKRYELPQIISDTKNTFQSSGQGDCACDCACSFGNGLSYSQIAVKTTLYHSAGFEKVHIDDNHVICYSPQHLPIVVNQSVFALASFFAQPCHIHSIPVFFSKSWGKQILQSTLKQMIALGLLVPQDETAPKISEIPDILTVWLHTTDRCNLSCAYCYLPHKKVDMSLETGYAAIEATFRSALTHHYRQVKLKYSGGEPFLRFPFIIQLHQHAQKLAIQHDLELDGVVLSNGTLLTSKIVKTMREVGLRLMVSLDGLKDYHNCQRRFSDRSSSFEAVSQAINLALAHNLIPDISITVSSRNIEGLPELVEWVLERGLHFSLNLYRENGLSEQYNDLRLEEEKIIKGMLAAYKVIESHLPQRSLLASLADRANLAMPHVRTCSAGQSYLVFDCKGNVSKCQMQMHNPVTDIQTHDPLAIVRADQNGLQNHSVDEKEECRTCQWRYWCAGGCPLETFRTTGTYNTKSPNCNLYKALYPEVLRLEGLRLLKYSSFSN